MMQSEPNRFHRVLGRLIVGLSNAQRRLLSILLRSIGPGRAYLLMAALARLLYACADAIREQSEAQCRAALGDARNAAQIQAIARAAFVHRVWNHVDLLLAPRLLNSGTYERHGGRIPDRYRTLLIEAQRRRQAVILLTGYYGPYDLLPIFLGLNGVRTAALYRRHPNREFDRYRRAVRGSSGCEMVPVSMALTRLPELLEAGETVALLADGPGGRGGVPVTFLGARTTAPRSVGLLAERYAAIVAVAAIRRGTKPFEFEILVADLFGPDQWRGESDPIGYMTARYTAAFEKIVRERPEQYLWLSRRCLPESPRLRKGIFEAGA